MCYMKTATVRDLKHDFARIESWIRQGERIEISKRGEPLMEIRPLPRRRRKPSKVDYLKMLGEIWGERVLTQSEVQAMADLADGEDG